MGVEALTMDAHLGALSAAIARRGDCSSPGLRRPRWQHQTTKAQSPSGNRAPDSLIPTDYCAGGAPASPAPGGGPIEAVNSSLSSTPSPFLSAALKRAGTEAMNAALVT